MAVGAGELVAVHRFPEHRAVDLQRPRLAVRQIDGEAGVGMAGETRVELIGSGRHGRLCREGQEEGDGRQHAGQRA